MVFRNWTLLGLLLFCGESFAVPSAPGKLKDFYEVNYNEQIDDVANCKLCHESAIPILNSTRNVFGKQVEELVGIKNMNPDFFAVSDLDADGDGVSNKDEIINGTLPYDAASF